MFDLIISTFFFNFKIETAASYRVTPKKIGKSIVVVSYGSQLQVQVSKPV